MGPALKYCTSSLTFGPELLLEEAALDRHEPGRVRDVGEDAEPDRGGLPGRLPGARRRRRNRHEGERNRGDEDAGEEPTDTKGTHGTEPPDWFLNKLHQQPRL